MSTQTFVSCPVKEQKPPPDLKRPWNAIALRASLVEVRLRDLRHTARPCENVQLWHLRPRALPNVSFTPEAAAREDLGQNASEKFKTFLQRETTG